jgi:hypothetical protein
MMHRCRQRPLTARHQSCQSENALKGSHQRCLLHHAALLDAGALCQQELDDGQVAWGCERAQRPPSKAWKGVTNGAPSPTTPAACGSDHRTLVATHRMLLRGGVTPLLGLADCLPAHASRAPLPAASTSGGSPQRSASFRVQPCAAGVGGSSRPGLEHKASVRWRGTAHAHIVQELAQWLPRGIGDAARAPLQPSTWLATLQPLAHPHGGAPPPCARAS